MNPYHIKGTKNSLGEIYHVAMHGCLISQDESKLFGIAPNKWDRYADHLYEFLDDLKIAYRTDNVNDWREMGISETSNTIFSRFHKDTVARKAKLIEVMAEANNWEAPFEKALKGTTPKVLIWLRCEDYEPYRNLNGTVVSQLIDWCLTKGYQPVLIGNSANVKNEKSAINLRDFWKDPFFKGKHFICKQLWFQHKLFQSFNMKASIGMMSGAMDGSSMFFGHKTIFFALESDAKPRMSKVALVVPGLNWFEVYYPKAAGLTELTCDELKRLHIMIDSD